MISTHCPICPDEVPFDIVYPERLNNTPSEFVARHTPDQTHFRIVRCRGCHLIYSNPILPTEKIMSLYRHSRFINESQLNNMAEDYYQQFRQILPLMNTKGNLLEIGCANGFFLQKIEKCGFKNLYGLEPNKAAVAAAPEYLKGRILEVELRPGLFPNQYFDVICFFQIFDHIIAPNEFLQTIHNYLKPNGIIFAIHHDIQSLLPRLLGSQASTYDISHIHLWDKNTMHKILVKNKFNPVFIKNIPNHYQMDHILRMLPLPMVCKEPLRQLLQWLHLNQINISAHIENMACAAYKVE